MTWKYSDVVDKLLAAQQRLADADKRAWAELFEKARVAPPVPDSGHQHAYIPDVIVADDSGAITDSESDALRGSVARWFRHGFPPRLANPPPRPSAPSPVAHAIRVMNRPRTLCNPMGMQPILPADFEP
jgi:hypothetical protein